MSLNFKEKLLKYYLKESYEDAAKACFLKNKKNDKKSFKKMLVFSVFWGVVSFFLLRNELSPEEIKQTKYLALDALSVLTSLLSGISFLGAMCFSCSSLAFRSEKTMNDYAKENLITKEEYIKKSLSKKVFSKKEMKDNSVIINQFKKEIGENNFNYLINKVMDEIGLDLGNAYFLYFMFENKDRLLKEKVELENKEKLLKKQIRLINSKENINKPLSNILQEKTL